MDSLILDGLNLLDDAPYCLGFGYDFGDGRPDTNTLESLLLDGDRVLGDRTGNREFTIPVHVKVPEGPTARTALSIAVTALLAVVDKPLYLLTWTPDGGLPIEWECYRGQADVGWSQLDEGELVQTVTLTFPAAPFGITPGAPVSASLAQRAAVNANVAVYDVTPIIGSARSPAAAVVSSSTLTSSAFMVHVPPAGADPTAPIVSSVTNNSVTVTNAQRLRGTYALALGVATFNAANGSPPSERIMRTTVTQQGVAGSTVIETPYTIGPDNTGSLIFAGMLTLPLVLRPTGASVTLTFTFADTIVLAGGNTQVASLMLLDTRGYTVATNNAVAGTPRAKTLYVDSPLPDQSVGSVFLSSDAVRTNAYAVPTPRISGGPLTLVPGTQRVALAFTDVGQPSLTLAYRPRWLAERTS